MTLIEVANFALLLPGVWAWGHFTAAEMACRGDGSLKIESTFMDRLEALRTRVGFALIVSSGYRSPAYNATVSDTGESGPHTTGRAVDLTIRGADAVLVLKAALALGFTGVGVSQKGASRFLHLDDLDDGRPMIWSY